MKQKIRLEDSSSQAGWMFADLFLALTVIFLATVSFVPNGNINANPEVNQDQNRVLDNNQIVKNSNEITLISSGFIGQYQSNEFEKFKKDVTQYLKYKDLPQSTTALYLEVVGHTTENGQPNDAGNLAALKFVIEARKALPKNLQNTSTSINLSPEVPVNQIRTKITFI